MAKGIEIGIGSDTKAFKQGIETGIIAPLDKAQEALEDLGNTGGPEDLERGIRDAQKATERLEDETKRTADAIDREFRESYRSVKQNSADSTGAARRNMQEVSNEAKQNAAETFSSFDGSAESFADGVQGTFGGLIASLPPLAAAIAGAAAIGVGLVVGQIKKAAEDTEEWKQKVADLTAELINVGEEGGPSIEYVVDKLKELATSTDDNQTNLEDLQKVATSSQRSFRDLANAYAGNTDGLRELIEEQSKVYDGLVEQTRAAENNSLATENNTGKLTERANAQLTYVNYLVEAANAAEEARLKEERYVQAGGPALERKAALVDAVNTAYDDAANAVDDYIDAESGIFDVDRYIAAMTARQKALEDYQQTLAEAPLTDEAKAFINEQGVDAAAAFLAGYKAATPEQQRALNDIWTEAARKDSAIYSDGITTSFAGQTIVGPSVKLSTDEADRQINELFKNPRTLKVKINPSDVQSLFSRAGIAVP